MTGIAAAERIAKERPINANAAELIIRNMAALFGVHGGVDIGTLRSLRPEVRQQVRDLAAHSSVTLYGPGAPAAIVEQVTPHLLPGATDDEKELAVMRFVFGRTQLVASTAQGDKYLESVLPDLTKRYAQVFAKTYNELGIIGHPLAVSLPEQAYFEGNIQSTGSGLHK